MILCPSNIYKNKIMKDETIIQIIFIFVFFAVSFILGLVPFKWKSFRED